MPDPFDVNDILEDITGEEGGGEGTKRWSLTLINKKWFWVSPDTQETIPAIGPDGKQFTQENPPRELNVPPSAPLPSEPTYGQPPPAMAGFEPDQPFMQPTEQLPPGAEPWFVKGTYRFIDPKTGKAYIYDQVTGKVIDEITITSKASLSDKLAEIEAALERELTPDEREQFALYGSLERPPTPRQLPPKYPWEIREGKADADKAEREAMNQYNLALQDAYEAIASMQQRVASGEMTPQEADKMASLIRQSLDATLKGTTPWQIETSMRKEAESRLGRASDLLSDRTSQGGQMGLGLLSGMYGTMLAGQGAPTNFDPFSYALSFQDKAQGGPELAQLAQALLKGSFQKGLNPQQGGF